MAKRPRLLILGGGVYQAPLIKRARALEIETIVATPLGPYPGIEIAHHHWDVDTTDEKTLMKLARDFGIDGVVTTGTDVCMPSLGSLVDGLGLSGPTRATANISSDKILMKQAFYEYSVPTAGFKVVKSLSEAIAAAENIGYPVMVKAADSSGSRGITKAETEADMLAAWGLAYSVSRNKLILIEQYLNGEEFGAQVFLAGDQVSQIFLHNDTVTAPPCQVPIGHSMPLELSDTLKNELFEIIERAVFSVKARNTVCNLDLISTPDGFYVIEIASRMGATCLPEVVAVYAGFDVYQYLIELALGGSPLIRQNTAIPNAAVLLRSALNGRVSKFRVTEEVIQHPSLIELRLDVDVNDYVSRFVVGPNRIGHIHAKGESAGQAESIVTDLAKVVEASIAYTDVSG